MIIAAAALRPMPGYAVSGDATVLVPNGAGYLLALVDALGHGPQAAESADVASAVIRAHAAERPKAILEACHAALRHKRGAAISIVSIDGTGHAVHAGVGNVRVRVVPEGVHHVGLVATAGVVGHQIRVIREQNFTLPLDGLGLMHSDGVGSRIDPLAVPRGPIDRMASSLLETWQRDTDDASLVLFALARGVRAAPPMG